MKVKTKLIIFGVVLVAIISVAGISTYHKVIYRNKVNEDILSLATIQYMSVDGSRKRVNPSNSFKIIFFFNTECGYCESEAKLIFSNVSGFKDADIYFLSIEEISTINEFLDQYKLSTSSGIEVGKVGYNVISDMGVNTYPMCFIYSPNGALLKKYVGQVKVEAIVRYLQ